MAGSSHYVALLRGINVGGNNIIPMGPLCATFAGMGLGSVESYIASGNVLFATKKADARRLEVLLERALSTAYGYEARVVVRTREQMLDVAERMPRGWKRIEAGTKYNVVFLRHEIDDESIVEALAPKQGIESLVYRPGVLYWSAKASEIGRTSMIKLAQSRFYKQVTVRNLNTTNKLVELMRGR